MEEDLDKKKNLEELKKFIEKDTLIKQKLIDIAPKAEYDYDEETRLDYSEMLFKEFQNIESAFSTILNLFSTNNELASIRQATESKLKEIKTRVMNE